MSDQCPSVRLCRYLSTWLAHEDPESVSVADGCTFTAWESAGRRGRSVAVVGGGQGKHIIDLEMYLRQHGARDEMESFQCFCDRGANQAYQDRPDF